MVAETELSKQQHFWFANHSEKNFFEENLGVMLPFYSIAIFKGKSQKKSVCPEIVF